MKINPTYSPIVCLLLAIISYQGCKQGGDFDRFGGFTGITTEATGYFYIDQIEDRYFIITPEGHGYRALGINHFHNMKTTDYDQVIKNIRNWGFNAGCYQGPEWMWERIPYTQGLTLVDISSFYSEDRFRFEDVFDSNYIRKTENRVKRIVEPQAQNKMLIGYFLTDIPVWTIEKYGRNWIDFFKSLPEGAPGKKVWKEWKDKNQDKPEIHFVGLIARQVYSTGCEIIRRYDKNHLIFTDRYLVTDMPDFVVNEVLPYADAIAVQPPSKTFDKYLFDGLYLKFNKPIYIADHVSSYATNEHTNTMEQIALDEKTYVDLYKGYVTEALSMPYIIGFNKCQYQDEIRNGLLKQGLIRENGEPYPTIDGIKKANIVAIENVYNKSGK
jgi:hypothetical protein